MHLKYHLLQGMKNFELPDGSYSVLFRVYLKKPKRTD